MRYTITPEQLNHLIEFAEDDRTEMDFDAIEALNYLHQAVQRHVMKRKKAGKSTTSSSR